MDIPEFIWTGWSDSDTEPRRSEAGARLKTQQSTPSPTHVCTAPPTISDDHRAGLPGGLGSPTQGARGLTAQTMPLVSVLRSGWKAGLLFSLGPAGAASSPRWNLNYVQRLRLVKTEHSEGKDKHAGNEYKIIPSRPSEP